MSIQQIIESRQTEKVIADQPLPVQTDRALIERVVAAGAWAPFHLPAEKQHKQEPLNAIMPWRAYVLDHEACVDLRGALDPLESGKIYGMLAAATAMVQLTWLPNKPSAAFAAHAAACEDQLFEPTLKNMEHLAAASAAAQNMLLMATELALKNYWSSGGVMRSEQVYTRLGIRSEEILLGSLFFFGQDIGEAQVIPGKLRDLRGPLEGWMRWVD